MKVFFSWIKISEKKNFVEKKIENGRNLRIIICFVGIPRVAMQQNFRKFHQ